MYEKNVEAVKGKSKYILKRISPYKKAIITIGAIGLTLALAIFGGIKLTSVNKNAFSINMADYDKIVRISYDPLFSDAVNENVTDLKMSESLSLGYNFTSQEGLNIQVHPDNATLIDVNPTEEYSSDALFKGCNNALVYNFGDEIENMVVDTVDTARVSQFDDFDTARYHTMYKVSSEGKGILIAGRNFVPYHQISENEAKQAKNIERFTDVHIRVGNKLVTFNNFIGINEYEQDNVKLLGIVVMCSDNNYYEYYVSKDQYALEAKYDASELYDLTEYDVLYAEGSAFPGMMPLMEDVYLVDRPVSMDFNDTRSLSDNSIVYLRTSDNRVIKTQRGNVYLSKTKTDTDNKADYIEGGSIVSNDVISEGSPSYPMLDISKDGNYYTCIDQGLYGSDTEYEFPIGSIMFSSIYKTAVENGENGWIILDTPTVAAINSPSYCGYVPIVAYNMSNNFSINNATGEKYQLGESITIAFRPNKEMSDPFLGEIYACYSIPIEYVMLSGADLKVNEQPTPVVK